MKTERKDINAAGAGRFTEMNRKQNADLKDSGGAPVFTAVSGAEEKALNVLQ